MSYAKRQTTRKIKRFLYYAVLLIITGLAGYYAFMFFYDNSEKTIVPERVVYSDQIEVEGLVVLNQQIIELNENQDVELFFKEGEKVSAGAKILSVLEYKSEDMAMLEELDRINSALDENMTMNPENYIDEITFFQNLLIDGDFENAEIVLEQVKRFNTSTAIKGSSRGAESYDEQDEETLKARKAELEAELVKSDNEVVKSNLGGIVSYIPSYIGKEYNLENVSEIKYDTFKQVCADEEDAFVRQVRVLDNFKAMVALKIDDFSKVSEYEVGDKIRLANERIGEIKAKITSMSQEGNKGVVIVEVKDEIHVLYDQEFAEFQIVREKREAFKLPAECLIKDSGGDGVLIKYKSSIVRYRPVSVIDTKGDFLFVEVGDSNSMIKRNGKMEYTIGSFDDVFIRPEKLVEGSIVQ